MRTLSLVPLIALFGLALLRSEPVAAAAPITTGQAPVVRKPAAIKAPTLAAKATAARRLAAAKALIDPTISEGQLRTSITLDQNTLKLDEHNFLVLYGVDFLSEAYAVFDEYEDGELFNAAVYFRLRSAAQHTYLVDCAVSAYFRDLTRMRVTAYSFKAGTDVYDASFKVMIDDAPVVIDDGRVWFALNPGGVRDMEVAIYTPKKQVSWFFQGCEITTVAL